MPNDSHGKQSQSSDAMPDSISVALMAFPVWIRVLSLAGLLALLWYIMITPSLTLKEDPKCKFEVYLHQLNNSEKKQNNQETLPWHIINAPSLALKKNI